jgi:nucleotide-binding universal stress UspA family protein
MLAGTDCEITLFYSKRNLFRFFSISEEFGSLSELEATWQSAAGREIAPTMQKAEQMLIKAGIEETQISVRIVDGSHNAASDILNAANRFGCGTIVMGQRGVTGVKEYSMGSVCRKVLQNSKAVALWLVP